MAKTSDETMKYFAKSRIKCACGSVIETGSTKENIDVEICASCHPFFTGKEKLVDTAGRVDRFKKRASHAKIVRKKKAGRK